MNNSSQRLLELFDLYLHRRCEPEEVTELIAMLERANATEALTPPMRQLWEELRVNAGEYPVDWRRMYERVTQVEDELSILNKRWRVRKIGRRIAIAASLALLAGGIGYWAVSGGRRPASVAAGGQGIMTASGQGAEGLVRVGTPAKAMVAKDTRKVVHLPDGSTVLLNRNSRLDYPPVFSGATREVALAGEAYFDITHMTGRPFLVHTGKLTTRVLGTAFNIRAYPGDRKIAITVTSGRVQVLKEDRPVGLLTENQQISYDMGADSLVRKKVDVRPLVAWKPEEVTFDDITMEEAARRIGRWFGVNVSFVDPVVKQCRVTATFYREDELDEILTVVCGVIQANYQIRGKAVTIDGKGCN